MIGFVDASLSYNLCGFSGQRVRDSTGKRGAKLAWFVVGRKTSLAGF